MQESQSFQVQTAGIQLLAPLKDDNPTKKHKKSQLFFPKITKTINQIETEPGKHGSSSLR